MTASLPTPGPSCTGVGGVLRVVVGLLTLDVPLTWAG